MVIDVEHMKMSKGMNAEEKLYCNARCESSDWLSTNFGVRFRYNALGDLNTRILFLQKKVSVLLKV